MQRETEPDALTKENMLLLKRADVQGKIVLIQLCLRVIRLYLGRMEVLLRGRIVSQQIWLAPVVPWPLLFHDHILVLIMVYQAICDIYKISACISEFLLEQFSVILYIFMSQSLIDVNDRTIFS